MACRVVVTDEAGGVLCRTSDLWQWLGLAPPDHEESSLNISSVAAALAPPMAMQSVPLDDGTLAHIIFDGEEDGALAETADGDEAGADAADDELAALERENRLLRETLDAVDGSIVVHDAELRFRMCNKEYHQRYPHLPPERELVGRHVSEVLRMSIRAGTYADKRALTDTEAYIAERVAQMSTRRDSVANVHSASSGRWSQVRVRWTPSGNRVTLRVDVTQNKRMEEELVRNQRVKTVGRIAGGVAHHFNNMLTVICANLDLLLQLPDLPARAANLAERALAGAERGGRLTHQLLTFAQRDVTRPRRINPNHFLDSIAALLEGALGQGTTLAMRHDEETPIDPIEDPTGGPSPRPAQVFVDPAKFETAMMNLMLNARDAIAARSASLAAGSEPFIGRVEIRTGRREQENGMFRVIAVADNGEGMPPEVAAEAFEPFFTTRHMSVASGLGLSQVYGFATGAGGAARISSTPGEGTVVEILLPIDPPAGGVG